MSCCVFLLFWIVRHGEEYDYNTTVLSADPLMECIPAGKGFVPVYFSVVLVIVIEYIFILGELPNVQDSPSSIRTCISRMRVLNY